MKKYFSLSKGFTLVELMVTISVIVILASVVVVGYDGYIDRVDQTNIATTVDAYAKSLKAYALEFNTYPKNSTCLPKDSECCSTSGDQSQSNIYCMKTTELSGTYNWSTANDSNIAKYVSGNPPALPTVDSWGGCVSGLTSWGPCKPAGSISTVGLAYIANQAGSNYTSNESSVSGRGFLVYFVATKFDCGTNNVMTFSGGNLSFTTAKYSASTSDYRECIVGLRNN